MATRADYLTKVQAEVDDTSSAATTVQNEAITETYAEIAAEIAPYITGPTSEQVAVTSATITPTNTYEEFEAVHYKNTGATTWDKLDRMTEDDYLNNHLNDTQTTPEYYLIRGNTVVLNGVPTSGTVRIQGIKVSPELVNSEVSIVPDRFTRVIVLGSIYRFLSYEKDPAALEYKGWYEEAKRNMMNQLGSKAPILKPSLR